MTKIPPFALFMHHLSIQNKERPDSNFEGCEEVLAFLIVRDANGESTNMTNLVQSLRFGTGPTIHRKVTTLVERGLIKHEKSETDGRAKTMSITNAGLALMKEKSKLMKQCLDS